MNKATYKPIKISELIFDDDNPRYFGKHFRTTPTQGQMYAILLEQYFATGLVESLLVNGFMPYEPLIVKPYHTKFIVIEGNRRLAALRFIQDNAKNYEEKFPKMIRELEEVPCIVFDEKGRNALENEQTYLGLRHFSGYRHWDPHSKALYLLRQLDGGVAPTELAVRLNTTVGRISRYIYSVQILKSEEKQKKIGFSDSFGKFWLLAEAIQRQGIKDFLELKVDSDKLKVLSYNSKKMTLLRSFLFGESLLPTDDSDGSSSEAAISDSRQLSMLADVLSDAKALTYFMRTKDLEKAALYIQVDEGDTQVDAAFEKCVTAIEVFASLKPKVAKKKLLLKTVKSKLNSR